MLGYTHVIKNPTKCSHSKQGPSKSRSTTANNLQLPARQAHEPASKQQALSLDQWVCMFCTRSYRRWSGDRPELHQTWLRLGQPLLSKGQALQATGQRITGHGNRVKHNDDKI